MRVRGEVVRMEEAEEVEERGEAEVGPEEKAVLRRRREGVRRGWKDWKREERISVGVSGVELDWLGQRNLKLGKVVVRVVMRVC